MEHRINDEGRERRNGDGTVQGKGEKHEGRLTKQHPDSKREQRNIMIVMD